ncbi:uncharacterized protein EKO05_0010237 [Ascochyta rabiei]|uniref:Uncharacterized protein n=1 Tax=Didymella rabiei TaxID=5454 RepID=A0A162WKP6_DIDRA|nr:uncharacterized protein EKO05_0010237 [Ascochyta rabiei]KZM19087.1 hypothetical protein ST47_g9773 [Ascochyta rabiei]UPX19989.1 hypothetical protein EKO05_0010237 [Ascochyta rabiei]
MAAPATPAAPQTPRPAQLHTPNGTWKHPKFDEITRRQYATAFDESNVRVIVANAGLLAVSLFADAVTSKVKLLEYAATPVHALVHHTPYSAWAILAIRLFFALNIGNALLPLVRRYYPDDLADIPLTPSQRTSMGLKASLASSHTPTSAYASPAYVTPPRYARSTPRSSFSNQGERPLIGSDSPRPSLGRSASNASYSPGHLGSSATKRASYGGGSPFNSSLFGESASSGGPGTPTPTPTPSTGKASVGLNNKWLYEKRRDSPRSGMFA